MQAPPPYTPADSQQRQYSQQQQSGPAFNELGATDFLKQHRWPQGLSGSMVSNLQSHPYRFMVVDDSGSMVASDGSMVTTSGKHTRVTSCSRWKEMCQAIEFHARFADAAQAPTEFRFLNNGNFVIGVDQDDGVTLNKFVKRLNGGCRGGTPLCKHVREIAQKIGAMEQTLRANGQTAVVVIFTDGQSSDGNVSQALKLLEKLPVWTVIRLCTDQDDVVDYWNAVDNDLELPMDVLDDLLGEGKEVTSANPWLTYGEPLHRLREFGFHRREMDLLDESPLAADQVRAVLSIILGGPENDYPHPEVDIKGCCEFVEQRLRQEELVWSPKTQALAPWIELKKLASAFGSGGGCSIM